MKNVLKNEGEQFLNKIYDFVQEKIKNKFEVKEVLVTSKIYESIINHIKSSSIYDNHIDVNSELITAPGVSYTIVNKDYVKPIEINVDFDGENFNVIKNKTK